MINEQILRFYVACALADLPREIYEALCASIRMQSFWAIVAHCSSTNLRQRIFRQVAPNFMSPVLDGHFFGNEELADLVQGVLNTYAAMVGDYSELSWDAACKAALEDLSFNDARRQMVVGLLRDIWVVDRGIITMRMSDLDNQRRLATRS